MPSQQARNPRMSFVEWLLLFVLSLLWGGAFCLEAVALAELPPFTIIFCRVALATIVLSVLAVMTGQKLAVRRGTWMMFAALGALSVVLPSALLLWSQIRIGTGLVSVLAATAPLFTALVAHFLTSDEKVTIVRLVGILVALAGVAIAMGLPASDDSSNLLAALAVLVAALCHAFAGVLARRLKAMPALSLAVGQLAAASMLSLPVALAAERPWTLAAPTAATWAAILALAVLSTALGYLVYFRLLAAGGAVNVALVSFLVPVTALLVAGFVLGEPLAWRVFGGVALVFAGLAALGGRTCRSDAINDGLPKSSR